LISTSREKLKKVRIKTTRARAPRD